MLTALVRARASSLLLFYSVSLPLSLWLVRTAGTVRAPSLKTQRLVDSTYVWERRGARRPDDAFEEGGPRGRISVISREGGHS